MTQKNPICPYVSPSFKLDEMNSKKNQFNKQITEEELFEIIEKKSGISKIKIISPCRKREYVDMRQLVAYILRTNFNRTLSSVGETLGDRDHTTIVNSIRKFHNLYETNSYYKNTCDNIFKTIKIKTENL